MQEQRRSPPPARHLPSPPAAELAESDRKGVTVQHSSPFEQTVGSPGSPRKPFVSPRGPAPRKPLPEVPSAARQLSPRCEDTSPSRPPSHLLVSCNALDGLRPPNSDSSPSSPKRQLCSSTRTSVPTQSLARQDKQVKPSLPDRTSPVKQENSEFQGKPLSSTSPTNKSKRKGHKPRGGDELSDANRSHPLVEYIGVFQVARKHWQSTGDGSGEPRTG